MTFIKFIPRGDTLLEAGDVLYVLSENSAQLKEIKRCLDVEYVNEGEYVPDSEIMPGKNDNTEKSLRDA